MAPEYRQTELANARTQYDATKAAISKVTDANGSPLPRKRTQWRELQSTLEFWGNKVAFLENAA